MCRGAGRPAAGQWAGVNAAPAQSERARTRPVKSRHVKSSRHCYEGLQGTGEHTTPYNIYNCTNTLLVKEIMFAIL